MAVVGRGFSDSLDTGLGSVALFFELESTIAAIDGHAEPAEEAHAEQLIVNECHGDACRFGLAYANRLHHGGQARGIAVCRLPSVRGRIPIDLRHIQETPPGIGEGAGLMPRYRP